MITEEQLGKIILHWNPETDSVNVIKDAVKEYEGDVWEINNDSLLNAILNLTWAEKYYNEYGFSAVSEHFCILSIDYEGNCLYGDWDEVKHISELERDLENWIKEQEAENAVKN